MKLLLKHIYGNGLCMEKLLRKSSVLDSNFEGIAWVNNKKIH